MNISTVSSGAQAQCNLAVAWMNRGHALMLAGDASASLQAYEQAICLLRTLPFAENPSWANSLGAAWMNRGQLLHRAHGLAQAGEALASFAAAHEVLEPLVCPENPWPRRNLAGTQLNRANLLLDLGRAAEAANAARAALELCRTHESADPVDAELALKARRVLCDALGQLLVAPGADQETLAREASEVVDDALALVRRGHSASGTRLAGRFFRYGIQLYRFHQPHFLAEFIAENLAIDPSAFRAIAREAVAATLSDPPRGAAYLIVGDAATERRLRTLRDLEQLRDLLAA